MYLPYANSHYTFWLKSVLCVYHAVGLSRDERRKNDLICHKQREHLYKQLALCKWSQLSFTCPISSTALRLIDTTPADCKGFSGYVLTLCLGYLVFWWFRAFPQAVFGTQMNPKKVSFRLLPSTWRSEVRLGCSTAFPEHVRIWTLLKNTQARQMPEVDTEAWTHLSDAVFNDRYCLSALSAGVCNHTCGNQHLEIAMTVW